MDDLSHLLAVEPIRIKREESGSVNCHSGVMKLKNRTRPRRLPAPGQTPSPSGS